MPTSICQNTCRKKKRHHLDGDALGTTRCKKFAIPSTHLRFSGFKDMICRTQQWGCNLAIWQPLCQYYQPGIYGRAASMAPILLPRRQSASVDGWIVKCLDEVVTPAAWFAAGHRNVYRLSNEGLRGQTHPFSFIAALSLNRLTKLVHFCGCKKIVVSSSFSANSLLCKISIQGLVAVVKPSM